jgi:hypothetical protein
MIVCRFANILGERGMSRREEYRKIKRPFPPTARAHPVAHPAPPGATPSRTSAREAARQVARCQLRAAQSGEGTGRPWGKAKRLVQTLGYGKAQTGRLGLSMARRRLVQTSGTVAMGRLPPLAHAEALQR